MLSYSQKLKVFEKYKTIFKKEGFIRPTIEKVLEIAWLDVWDTFHIFRFAKKIPHAGTYLEIGSWLGGSMLCAFLGTRASGNSVSFIGIDLRIHTELFTNTKIIPDVRFIKTSSNAAVPRILDNSANLIFIDGAHHYEQVKQDVLNYWPKLKVGGILLGHDYSKQKVHRGVVKATNEIFGKRFKLLEHSRVFMVKKNIRSFMARRPE